MADASGIEKKVNIEPNNGVEKLTFEIYADGEWKELSYMSTDWEKEKIYWIRESFDLAEYAGKTVKFRWTHYSYSGKDSGGALDNVVLEEKEGDKAIFNKSGWNAGKVNYNMATNSGDIFTLVNKGANTLKVKSATFATGNFETSIKAGDEIAAGEGQKFNVQFNAKDAVSTVSDNLTVTFESGYTISLPVEGTALASNVCYYSFEDNDLDHNWKNDFTMIDVDRAATSRFTYYGTECPESGGVFAFTIVYERPNHNGIAPISGDAVLMAGTPESENVKGDNWIISRSSRQQKAHSSTSGHAIWRVCRVCCHRQSIRWQYSSARQATPAPTSSQRYCRLRNYRSSTVRTGNTTSSTSLHTQARTSTWQYATTTRHSLCRHSMMTLRLPTSCRQEAAISRASVLKTHRTLQSQYTL